MRSGAAPLDLDACDREPIATPGAIQPLGALLAFNPNSECVTHAAAPPHLRTVLEALGQPIFTALPGLAEWRRRARSRELERWGSTAIDGATVDVFAHEVDGRVIVELEELGEDRAAFEDAHPMLEALLEALARCHSIDDIAAVCARTVRAVTGFDRVLVYRFDPEWNGAVIAEDRNEALPSYLGLRFPASDIPAQARALYTRNRLRLIADAAYAPCAIQALDAGAAPLDLSASLLRSVSPVHLAYMRAMGTGASMSVSLLVDGALWGLIACHNAAPRKLPHGVRAACDVIGRMVSLQLAAHAQAAAAEERVALGSVAQRLLGAVAAREDPHQGLLTRPDDLLAVTRAAGAALTVSGRLRTVGETPPEAEIRRLIGWLERRLGSPDDVFATDRLGMEMPDAEGLRERASGVIAISVSRLHPNYVLWFRPEWVRTVTWAGEPAKRVELGAEGAARLHPRQSFAAWAEIVRDAAAPWTPGEIAAARDLRHGIVEVVLKNVEELAALSGELRRSNKELEAFSYSVSHDLRAPFRHIVGYAQLLKKYEGEKLSERGNRFIDTIVESAMSAGTLVDSLLTYSQMGRATLHFRDVDMGLLFEEEARRVRLEAGDRPLEIAIGPLPSARGDPAMLRLVVQNLLANAVKFTRGRAPARVRVDAEAQTGWVEYRVADNGVGFDMAYVGKLFGVFQRLHQVEEFEGTGIGLANVKRIVERHGGEVWADGVLNKGATFCFTLPATEG